MRNIPSFLIFFVVFFSIYFSLNYYVLSRLTFLLGIEKNLVFWFLLWFASLSFILANIVENICANLLSKIIYVISSVWMGILTIFFGLLGLHHLLSIFIPFDPFVSGVVVVVLTLALTTYSYTNAQRHMVKTITIHSKKIKKNIKLVQLSDLHLGPIKRMTFLHNIIKEVNDLNPDLVVISGDLVDGPGKLPLHLLEPLEELPCPVFYSIGNHERYVGLDVVKKLLSTSKVKLIQDAAVRYKELAIIGIDDSDDKQKVNKTLPTISYDKKRFSVLLYHRPDSFDFASKHIDLMLSGHTHGGQIWPFNYLVKLSFPRIKGLYKKNNAQLYVNPGTSTWGPPMRLGSKNEIVVFNLLP